MEWYEVFLKVLGAAAPLLTAAVGYLTAKYKFYKKKNDDRDKEYEAIKETCKLSLRQSLQSDYEYYTELGYCSIDDKSEVENEYYLYHEVFKGNKRGTLYYRAIMALPNEPQEKIEIELNK